METKSELFDLRREKQELDAFLSTLAETAEAHLRHDAVQSKEAIPFSADAPSVPEQVSRLSSTLELEGVELTLDEAPAPASEEKTFVPDDRDTASGTRDSISFDPVEKSAQESETAPSWMSSEEERKSAAPSGILDAESTKPPENFETAGRFPEATEGDEAIIPRTRPSSASFAEVAGREEMGSSGEPAPAQPLPQEEKKAVEKPAPERKKEKTNAYDFAPEGKSTGIGKWVAIGVIILLVIAALAGYLWLYPERVSKTIEIIKSYVPVAKTEERAQPAAAKGIQLLQIRQKLVYNITLKRRIRVLEGLAENITPRPVSRVKLVAAVFNSEGAVLATTESFCGNIIIDDKLESLDAGEMLLALKDVKTMEDRIPSKGQMPFMIVFTGEPTGVFRLALLPIDFKQH